MSYTWVPFYKELALNLLDFENRQEELLAILARWRDEGEPIAKFIDRAINGIELPLQEIDPFTFFSVFNRGIKEVSRLSIMERAAKEFNILATVPQDVKGVPRVNNLNSWFFKFLGERNPEDIANLWQLARLAIRGEQVPDNLFVRCLLIAGRAKLTMGLYWMDANRFMAFDKNMVSMLKKKNITLPGNWINSWNDYLLVAEIVQERFQLTLPEISQEAWDDGVLEIEEEPEHKKEVPKNYWVFQANPDKYDLVGALRAEALSSWTVSQNKKLIHADDRVVIWQTGSDGGCFALATVLSVPAQRTNETADFKFWHVPVHQPSLGVSLKIDNNLWDRPIHKDEVVTNPLLTDFPAGQQGTNISITQKQFETMELLAKKNMQSDDTSNEAKRALENWFPDESTRRAVASALGDSIEVAHAVGPNSWEITLNQNYLRMNVGPLEVFVVNNNGVRVTLDADKIPVAERERYRARNYRSVGIPTLTCEMAATEFSGTFPYIRDALHSLIRHASTLHQRSGWYKSHSVGIVEYLNDFLKRDLPQPAYYNSSSLHQMQKKNLSSRNIILYGPPGTGKTWRLRHEFFERFTDRNATLTQQERAAQLVQGMSWWEVVAMALLDQHYGRGKVEDIFTHPLVTARHGQSSNNKPRNMLWAALQVHTKNDCPNVKYESRTEPLIFWKDEQSVWSVDKEAVAATAPELIDALKKFNSPEGDPGEVVRRYRFTTFHQSFSYEDFVEGIKPVMSNSAGTNLEYEIRNGVFKEIADEARANHDQDYALFIDEINRGNIAGIFGELITLIEDDKRLGAENWLKVILPYSREEWGVPDNLYIIGTMNSADRSVEALDTALRRRFTFEEMRPDRNCVPEAVDFGIDMRRMFDVMNARLERLLDHDHCIGHSYFMEVETLSDLKRVFKNKILPLLQEYFYGSPARIGMVLGGKFVIRNTNPHDFAKGDWDDGLAEEKEVYSLADISAFSAAEFESIYA